MKKKRREKIKRVETTVRDTRGLHSMSVQMGGWKQEVKRVPDAWQAGAFVRDLSENRFLCLSSGPIVTTFLSVCFEN